MRQHAISIPRSYASSSPYERTFLSQPIQQSLEGPAIDYTVRWYSREPSVGDRSFGIRSLVDGVCVAVEREDAACVHRALRHGEVHVLTSRIAVELDCDA